MIYIHSPLQQGATYINGNYFPSSTGLDFGMSAGDRGRAAMYATSGGGFSRKPTADRMTLMSSRNQLASNVVSSVGEGSSPAQWDIVYYDTQGNFVSGDITNNIAVVAISDKDSKHCTF